MPRLPRLRYRLSIFLLVVGLLSIVLAPGLQYGRVAAARDAYRLTVDLWHANRITLGEVAKESEILLETEAAAPWITRDRAIVDHCERMTELLQIAQSRSLGTTWAAADSYERSIQPVKENLARYAK